MSYCDSLLWIEVSNRPGSVSCVVHTSLKSERGTEDQMVELNKLGDWTVYLLL